MKKIKQFFKFEPFSKKQRKVLNWWTKDSPVKEYDGIIADGAIRSGKTVSMSLSFALWAMSSFNGQNFAMCGKTIGSFRRNVLFWLKLMLKSRGYRVADHRADNLVIISKGSTENYFYIFGGKDERSQDLIQGITLAGVFFDEVALMPESFVNQATLFSWQPYLMNNHIHLLSIMADLFSATLQTSVSYRVFLIVFLWLYVNPELYIYEMQLHPPDHRESV